MLTTSAKKVGHAPKAAAIQKPKEVPNDGTYTAPASLG